MTRRLSSSTRSHTEDSIFLRPDEDPVWLDEPAKIEKLGDGVPKNNQLPKCKDGPADGQSPQGEEVFMHKVYALVVQIHCWAAVFVTSQVTVREQTASKKKTQCVPRVRPRIVLRILEPDRFLSSPQGYWVFFMLEGNGPVSSIYKALQVIDFYLGFILPCHPIFGMDVSSRKPLMLIDLNSVLLC